MNGNIISPSLQSQVEAESRFRPFLDAVSPGFIAGGALRDYYQSKPFLSDIDVFFADAEGVAEAQARIAEMGIVPIYDTERLAGYKIRGIHVQLVKHRLYATPEDAISEFDFTVCAAAIDQQGRVLCHRLFFEDLAANRLSMLFMNCPLDSLRRLQKYIKKGFTADNAALLTLARAIQTVDLEYPRSNSLEFYASGERRRGRFEQPMDTETIELTEKAKRYLSEMHLQDAAA